MRKIRLGQSVFSCLWGIPAALILFSFSSSAHAALRRDVRSKIDDNPASIRSSRLTESRQPERRAQQRNRAAQSGLRASRPGYGLRHGYPRQAAYRVGQRMREVHIPLPRASRPVITALQAERRLEAVLKVYKRDVDRAERVIAQAKGGPSAESDQDTKASRKVHRMVNFGVSAAAKQAGLQDFDNNSYLRELLRQGGFTTNNQQFRL